jgi:hypothetical protein
MADVHAEPFRRFCHCFAAFASAIFAATPPLITPSFETPPRFFAIDFIILLAMPAADAAFRILPMPLRCRCQRRCLIIFDYFRCFFIFDITPLLLFTLSSF